MQFPIIALRPVPQASCNFHRSRFFPLHRHKPRRPWSRKPPKIFKFWRKLDFSQLLASHKYPANQPGISQRTSSPHFQISRSNRLDLQFVLMQRIYSAAPVPKKLPLMMGVSFGESLIKNTPILNKNWRTASLSASHLGWGEKFSSNHPTN
jgi:hypothetical protein